MTTNNRNRNRRSLENAENRRLKLVVTNTARRIETSNGSQGVEGLIPWEDIWTLLRIAKLRGNSDMIEAFYDALFKDANFKNKRAWSASILN